MNLEFILLGFILTFLGLFLKDLGILLKSNKRRIMKEKERLAVGFNKVDFDTRYSTSSGSILLLDDKGKVIIKPTKRLSVNSYI